MDRGTLAGQSWGHRRLGHNLVTKTAIDISDLDSMIKAEAHRLRNERCGRLLRRNVLKAGAQKKLKLDGTSRKIAAARPEWRGPGQSLPVKLGVSCRRG